LHQLKNEAKLQQQTPHIIVLLAHRLLLLNFVDKDGQQYVLNSEGRPVFGAWIGPDYDHADPPVFRANLDDPPE
jgi:hypothetical protein